VSLSPQTQPPNKIAAQNSRPRRTKENFLVFGAPSIEQAEIDEVVAVLRSGWVGSGPRVARFEEAFRAYKGWGHAVAVNSCTAALHVSMLAAGIRPGDEVITSPMTFCATVNAIIHAGATPVLADINPQTMNLDPRELERSLTRRTRAVLPVHFAGRPCDMDGICDVARRHELLIIEDCAHAIETEYDGQKAGTFGEFGCFSFYVTKNAMTAEGGMVLARNEQHAARIKTLALHGMNKDAWKRFGDDGYRHYSVVEAGFKYNMTDIQAALGIHQLARIERNRIRREAVWNRYNQELRGLPLALPPEPEQNTRHAYHLYTVGVDPSRTGITRDAFLDSMTRRHIGVGVHYLSLPEHPYYQKRFGWRPQAYPNAMRVGRQTVSLPLSPKLTDDDVSDVIDAVRGVLAEAGARHGMAQQTRAVA
jgi:dTDP-4-amino-4,6-dideoxygalactose transaminase